MGRALEVLTGRSTAPGTTFAALTVNTGNSFTVRSAAMESPVLLLTAWGNHQADGELRVFSPRMHDGINGIRLAVEALMPVPLINPRYPQRLFSQDVLTVQHTGSATAGDVETDALLLYYHDLPGISANLVDPDFVRAHMIHLAGVNVVFSASTSGDYGSEQTLVADVDNLKANTDYALLGALSTIPVGTIRIRGAATGNLGIGIPGGSLDPVIGRDFFTWLSDTSGLPCIPVFNAADRGSILVDIVNNEVSAAPIVTFMLAELAR